MARDPEGDSPIDLLTSWMMRQSSRRSFLGKIAVAGFATFAFIPGMKRLAAATHPDSVGATTVFPDSIPCFDAADCGDPCRGLCSCSYSDCITGGEACSCTCSGDPCTCVPTKVEAYGSWQCVRGYCFFSCTCLAC